MTRRGWWTRAVTAAAALLLAGCASVDRPGPGPGSVPVSSLDCSAASQPGPLPDRSWVALASCPFQTIQVVPGQPEPTPSPRRPVVVHGNLGPLVAALRQPDAPRASTCTMELSTLSRFWLVDRDGLAYEPRVPLGPCGEPSRAVVSAMLAIPGG